MTDKDKDLPFGITPAWAGKRVALQLPPLQVRDHPRVGGEKRSDRLDYYFPQGSPPRGRGKVSKGIKPSDERGITPAWAGKR